MTDIRFVDLYNGLCLHLQRMLLSENTRLSLNMTTATKTIVYLTHYFS